MHAVLVARVTTALSQVTAVSASGFAGDVVGGADPGVRPG
jgi:hypothetical protein